MNESFRITCPSCRADLGEDDWEFLPENEVHRMTCDICQVEYFMSLFECEACGSDNLILSLVGQDCLDRICRNCGHRPQYAGDGDEESYL